MIPLSSRELLTALLLSLAVCFISGDTMAASRRAHSAAVELDGLIPRDKWEGSGLNKLTTSEQQILANEIAALVGSTQSTENTNLGWKDKSQWRKLQRGMSKDDVRNLLGEPGKVSVGRYYEFWYYAGGDVTFDKKARVDSWDEP